MKIVKATFTGYGDNMIISDIQLDETNSKNIEIPDFIGYSKREVDTYKKLTGIDITLEGNGYVYEQNKEDDKIYLKLKDRYVEQKKNNEDT